jgi:TRAP-type uncharacterized transport system substrate-binding protein
MTSLIDKMLARAALATVALLAVHSPAFSQAAPAKAAPAPSPEAEYRYVMNNNTITILGASLSGAYIKIVEDIAKAVNDGEKLRVLPIVGDGGSQNIKDLLYMRGVDAGIVMSTSMDGYKGKPLYGNLPARIQYIARLYEEEFHIVGGPTISSVEDLNGKKVGFHGGALVSGQHLFGKLNVKPAEALQVDFFKGLDQVKTGEIAAIVRATASPMQDLDAKFDPAAHRLVSIPFPESLLESYLPGELTHKNYPRILPEGKSVQTVAIGVVLATYAWQPGSERYRRVARFTEAFFSNIEKLMADKNRHPKWDDVNLAATLPGWQRFPPAQEWLKRKGYPMPDTPAAKAPPGTSFTSSTQKAATTATAPAKVKAKPAAATIPQPAR